MDYKTCRDTKNQMSNLTSRLTMLEELHKETMEKINNTQQSCNHEFIFINKKYENKAYEYLQYGKCLICGKCITLTPKNINTDTREKVDEGNIIDVATEVEYWNLDRDCSENKSEIEEAQRVFNRLMNESDYEKDTIKSVIVHAVNEVKPYKKKK